MQVQSGVIFLLFCGLVSSDASLATSNSSESYGHGIRDDMVEWSGHPCRRDCTDPREYRGPMSCRYGLTVELYTSMSKACYDCPRVLEDCNRRHCIVADGDYKVVIVANRQVPGTPIEVCEGDTIVVDVTNALPTETTSIHWHGLHQRKTPHMDGVPYITQCPILPGETFRYEFEANRSGTYVWHSHSGEQRADGLFGALIIRSRTPTTLYDLDEHEIVINEWTAASGMSSYVLEHQNGYPQMPHTILVNGLGPRSHSKYRRVPKSTFNVQKGKRYRFRLINVGAQNCPIMVSVDNHTMLAISVDGADIKPVEGITWTKRPVGSLLITDSAVDAIRILSGERYDFVIDANQPVGNYIIHFDGESSCLRWNCHQVAILKYKGAPKNVLPAKNLSNIINPRILNPFNQGTETPDALSIPTLDSVSEDDEDDYKGDPDHQFFVSYDFFSLDNDNYHRKNLYGFYQVREKKRVQTPQLNHLTFTMPNFPILTQPEMITHSLFCNYTGGAWKNCTKEFCACTQLLQAKLEGLVEVVMLDEGRVVTNHPMHLHGYHFRVVAMEKVDRRISVERFRILDREGKVRRKLTNAPLKDTVLVPTGGYTILRFRANNPGYWFFHCHIDSHATNGMALIFKVGEHKDFPEVPEKFPKCYGSRKT